MYNDDDDLRDIHFEVYGEGKVWFEFRPWMTQLLPIYRRNRASEYVKQFRQLAAKQQLEELDAFAATINEDLFHAYHEAYEGRVEAVENFVGLTELAEAAAKEATEALRRELMVIGTAIPFAPTKDVHYIDVGTMGRPRHFGGGIT